jgi:pimeloyl-ACP methyl ester carboxylesterase
LAAGKSPALNAHSVPFERRTHEFDEARFPMKASGLFPRLIRFLAWACLGAACCLHASLASPAWGEEALAQPDWGTVVADATQPGVYRAEVRVWPADGRLVLPANLPPVVHAYRVEQGQVRSLDFIYETASSHVVLQAGPVEDASRTAPLWLATAEHSQQFADGRIALSALDAQVHGDSAKLESDPGHYRIGFWTNPQDHVSWKYRASRWGRYSVLLTYATASPDGTEVEVEFAGEKLRATLPSTGSWYHYRTLEMGPLQVRQEGDTELAVRCLKATGGAVINLKAVILRPCSEGQPIVSDAEGRLTLHGRDATVRATTLRYEPAEIKLTLGYWVRPTDLAEWQFDQASPGEYLVEILQGCGKDQGGSEMILACGPADGRPFREDDQQVPFTVVDTGHFQNFQSRLVGTLRIDGTGPHRLSVRPARIAHQAAMDLRAVRLLPVASHPLPSLPLLGERLEVDGRPAFVLLPEANLRRQPQPWVFYAPTLPGLPDEHERWMHERFLAAGVAVAGIDVGECYGSPLSHKTLTSFHESLVRQKGFAMRPCLLGRSRGGLWMSSWGSEHLDRMSGLAGIYPVFDLRTYPGVDRAAEAYGLAPAALEQSLETLNPIQRVQRLAAAGVPTFLIHGDQDAVVPLEPNSNAYVARYREAGHADAVELVVAAGQGHNYWEGFFRCEKLVEFVIRRAQAGAEESR